MISKEFYQRFARTVVLVISPHPDDSVLGAGGLIHRLTDPVAWSAPSGVEEADWPAVYTVVMTSGSRGVDDEYFRRYQMDRLQRQDPGLSEYLLRRMSGADRDDACEAALNAIREDLRCEESVAEGRILRVRESFFLKLPGIYENHAVSEDDRATAGELLTSLVERHDGWQRLVLVPHRDDMHPVHKLSTSLVLDFIDDVFRWRDTRVWQYESPWITFGPHQVEVVVPFDGIGMATKAEAMSVHRSQEYRTRYSDVARFRAQMKAETYPELLAGFGQSAHQWQYVEAFQEMRPVMIYELVDLAI